VKIQTKQGSPLSNEFAAEFDYQFTQAQHLTQEFISNYESVYKNIYSSVNTCQFEVLQAAEEALHWSDPFEPNRMQAEALSALKKLRGDGERKALIISATGTGKTFLSAFDAQACGAQRLLFVVHRENIARDALASFKKVFGSTRTYGLYTGNQHELKADFLFCTVQTISRPNHLTNFSPECFDYIVVDESHRAGAASYDRFISHFKPSVLLGMTATPERTDGADIMRYFDYNIAYEIRLQRALEEEMLCPFHYFGVTDLTVNGKSIDEYSDFNLLTARERVTRILEKSELYGCHDGVVRGLVFCSRVKEAHSLSSEFNKRGYRTVALDGTVSEDSREQAILRLEAAPDKPEKLDYIFTVDIFNEGIDIPQCNQIILLRPTQSSIIFVQQLGRGLRKVDNKEKYLTVIDFIGNYTNNYMIPIALFGDRTYDKDRLRRLMVNGSECLSGTSTINFDRVSRERIFDSINLARTHLLSDLRADFQALHYRIGRLPMMKDFSVHDLRDPAAFASCKKSFYAFSHWLEPEYVPSMSQKAEKVLEVYSRDALNGKTLEEPLMMKRMIENPSVSIQDIVEEYFRLTKYSVPKWRWDAAIRCLNMLFTRESIDKKLVSVGKQLGIELIERRGDQLHRLPDLDNLLSERGFLPYLQDLAEYAQSQFLRNFDETRFVNGFVRYRKYRRSDVFRILGALENPVAQNVGGYLIAQDKSWCPIFVTYHKEEYISSTTKYEDMFIDRNTMQWFTKNNRTLDSPDVQFFRTAGYHQRIPLFVKKNNDEGIEFYFLGDVRPDPSTFVEQTMPDDKGCGRSVVRMALKLDQLVEETLFEYINE
jgi:superfamily II DNA or RNA helicase